LNVAVACQLSPSSTTSESPINAARTSLNFSAIISWETNSLCGN